MDEGATACSLCGARLYVRKPDSIERTSALLIAAFILFIPANLLPVMETGSLFGSQVDTIMSGVIYLWQSGSWPLAALVFLASIVVPLVKMLTLSLLVASVYFRVAWLAYERTRLYRMIEFVGRWSMLDIYVVTMLAALVRMQSLATIKAGPGTIAFGAVVVLTMLASMAFDPRLIWDNVKDDNAARLG
jgi:paraquat-inducible protein A